jgi:hypothetical protein
MVRTWVKLEKLGSSARWIVKPVWLEPDSAAEVALVAVGAASQVERAALKGVRAAAALRAIPMLFRRVLT